MVLRLLLEGNSVSSVERATEVHHTTILKLLVKVGEKCERIMAEKVRNVEVSDVEADELWSFVGKKQKRVRPSDDPNFGDCYVFVVIERHSKLVPNIAMGKRDQRTTNSFIEGVRHATSRTPFQVMERSNLSTRMSLRRFTRLTNGFSKKWENHCAAVVVWYCWYNFGPVHKSLRGTPAMEAGIADHVWSVRELLEAE